MRLRSVGVLRRLLAAGMIALLSAALAPPASAYPPADSGYLDYGEMVAEIEAIAADAPHIARLFSIGRSHQGRELWAAKISDNVAVDEDEPEVLFDGGMHAREHMTTEMAVALFRRLVSGYGSNARITRLVDERETTIIFHLNPDGSEYDHASGTYRLWRKNRQPTPGSAQIGTDINRNFGYRWGTNPLNASPAGETYRGPSAWSTPEARAFRDYVTSRVVGGEQQIRVHVTFHQYGRVVLYPFGYTTEPIPPDMDAGDHRMLTTMAAEMGRRSGYGSAQSSHGGINVGNQMDWLYATYRMATFTFEMGDEFYMPDEAIPTETARNMDAALYAIERADCPYAVVDPSSARCHASGFRDVDTSAFKYDILWLYDAGITRGCAPDRFCPATAVTRAEMATFLDRALELPAATKDHFDDDDRSIHEDAINRLAEARITYGCAQDRFCPASAIPRDQMASFLARALDLPRTPVDHFDDDDANIHEPNIDAIAAARIAGGCAADAYCPASLVTRGQMAAFLHRAMR